MAGSGESGVSGDGIEPQKVGVMPVAQDKYEEKEVEGWVESGWGRLW